MPQELNEVGSAARATRSPCLDCPEDDRPGCIESCRKRLAFADWDHGRTIMAGFIAEGLVKPMPKEERMGAIEEHKGVILTVDMGMGEGKMVSIPMKGHRVYSCCGEPLGSPHAETCIPGVKNPCNICGKEQQLDKLGRKTGYCQTHLRARMVALNEKQAEKRKAEKSTEQSLNKKEETIKTLKMPFQPWTIQMKCPCKKCGEINIITIDYRGE